MVESDEGQPGCPIMDSRIVLAGKIAGVAEGPNHDSLICTVENDGVLIVHRGTKVRRKYL